MNNPKAWQIFRKLLPGEIKGLEQELKKDTTQQGADLLRLFRLFKKALQKGELPGKVVLARKIAAESPSELPETQQIAYLHKLLSYLRNTIEQFVVLDRLKADTQLWNRQLLAFYLSRDLDAFFPPLLRQTFDRLHDPGETARNVDFFRDSFELDALAHIYRTKHKDSVIEDRTGEMFLACEDAFLHQKMYHMVVSISYEKNLGIRMPVLFDDEEILPLVDRRLASFREESGPYSGYSDTFEFYRKLYGLIRGAEDIKAEDLRALLLSSRERLHAGEFREMYAMIRNYYIGLANQTRRKEDYARLYGVFRDSILDDFALYGAVPHNILKGLIISAIRAGMLEEAGQDLERIVEMLPEGDDREELYAFNRARILFEKGDFAGVARLLSDETGNPRSFHEPFYDIPGRILLLMAWYEMLMKKDPALPPDLRSDRDLERRAETERRYLNRGGKTVEEDHHRKGFRNFFRLYSRLVTRIAPEEFADLATEILDTMPLAEPEWLLRWAEKGEVLPVWFGGG
jgi:hypothetical protein